jgi:hypothetical protein
MIRNDNECRFRVNKVLADASPLTAKEDGVGKMNQYLPELENVLKSGSALMQSEISEKAMTGKNYVT